MCRFALNVRCLVRLDLDLYLDRLGELNLFVYGNTTTTTPMKKEEEEEEPAVMLKPLGAFGF